MVSIQYCINVYDKPLNLQTGSFTYYKNCKNSKNDSARKFASPVIRV